MIMSDLQCVAATAEVDVAAGRASCFVLLLRLKQRFAASRVRVVPAERIPGCPKYAGFSHADAEDTSALYISRRSPLTSAHHPHPSRRAPHTATMNAAVVKAGLALAGLAASLHWVVEGGGFSSNVVLLNSRNWYASILTCTI